MTTQRQEKGTGKNVDTLGPLQDSVRSSFRSSDRSIRSNGSSSSTTGTGSNNSTYKRSSSMATKKQQLHGNLMRSHKQHRNPMDIYQVLEILGEGSMGSVSRVVKRRDAVGGSARQAFVEKHSSGPASAAKRALQTCCGRSGRSGGGIMPCLASWLRLPPKKDALLVDTSSSMRSSVTTSTDVNDSSGSQNQQQQQRSIYRKQSSLVTYNKEKHKEVFYALKSIHLDRCSNKEYVDELKNEVAILRNIDHPNIVRAIETFDYKHQLYMVLELCSGGDLYTREPYTEAAAQTIVKSMFSAVAYLHIQGIVHRDLKFENIMFSSPHTDVVKIIDFGLSKKYASNEVLHDQVGTVYTMAPELLAGDYNEKADVWSLGVIAFMLLSSSMPFYGKDRVHVIKRIIQGKYHFKARRWASVSQEARNFVTDCLTNDPKLRPSADEAQHSLWVRQRRKKPARCIDEEQGMAEQYEILDKIEATMATFATYSKLKQLALMVVAYKSTTEEIGHLRDIFQQFDTLGNGEITLPEFKALYQAHYDFTDEELENLFSGIDLDGTGVVHYIEFLAATIESHGSIDEERLAEAFDRLDCDDSGWITVANLKEFLGDDVPESYLDEVIDEADIEKDHRISYDEFIALWNEDDDQKYTQNRAAAYSRHSSKMSAFSSFDEDVTRSQRSNDSTDMSSVDGFTGTAVFKERKHLSVRGGWV